MARRDHGAAAEALEGLESSADRLSDWLEQNFRLVAALVGVLLLIAGLGTWLVQSGASEEERASTALAKAREDYLSAMGAGPGALEVSELANPEAMAQIRSEYEGRFAEVAGEHRGTVAGTLAALEAAGLASDAGRSEDALERAQEAVAGAPRGAVRGMALQRLAQIHEEAGHWEAAAEAHAAAAEIHSYPLRGFALADAARARAQAGDAEAALALYGRVASEHPALELPEHQRTEWLELEAAAVR